MQEDAASARAWAEFWPVTSAAKIAASALSSSTWAPWPLDAADETGDGPEQGKYRVRLDDLDRVGAKAVENALNSDLIIVDEISPMELSRAGFILAVEKAIASPKLMPVVLRKRSGYRLAKLIEKTRI